MNHRIRNLLGLSILLAVWAVCWGESFMHPGSFDAGPLGPDWLLAVLPFVATITLGIVVPSWAWFGGALMYAPYFLWLPLHLRTYDGSEGASLAGVGTLILPIPMLFLAILGLGVGFSRGAFRTDDQQVKNDQPPSP